MKRRRSIVILLCCFFAISTVCAQDFELGFSPGGSSLKVVLDSINSAKASILVACYEFTSRDIAEALENAAHRGIRVRIVADFKASQGKYSQISVMRSAGIPIRLDRRYAIMHNKFMVIDESGIETGSFNYTDGAISRNAENAVWEWNAKDKAMLYAAEWQRLWEESE